VPFLSIALEAQMTHNLNHLERPVQKAGQTGTALPIQPLPSNASRIFMSGPVRVAGGGTAGNQTSTAALASFRHGLLRTQRRAPRHPAIFDQETAMNSTAFEVPHKTFIVVLARVTLGLLLWTLGASAMDLRVTQIQPKIHRVVVHFPIDRAHAEELQRWVNSGHDPWCLDPQSVAASALRRISPDLAEYESASLSLELVSANKTESSYAFHSLDGRTTYRVTLRRYLYLLPSAGSLDRVVWVPETAEISTPDARD
jgi:hypothetical protein